MTAINWGVAKHPGDLANSLKYMRDKIPLYLNNLADEFKTVIKESIISNPDRPAQMTQKPNWLHRKAVLLGMDSPNLDAKGKEIWYERLDYGTVAPATNLSGPEHKLEMTGALLDAISVFRAEFSDDGHISYVGVDSDDRSYHQYRPGKHPGYRMEEVLAFLRMANNGLDYDFLVPWEYAYMKGVIELMIDDNVVKAMRHDLS